MTAYNQFYRIFGRRVFQYISAVTVNLGIICSEIHYGWPSPYSPVLRSGEYIFTITSEQESWLTVSPLIGGVFGAFFTGLVVDFFGRKKMVIFSALPFCVSWLLVAFAQSYVVMFIGRLLAGLADGLSFTAVPMYIGEISDPKIRGLLTSICPVCIVFGLLLVNILGAFFSLRTTALIGTFFPVLLLLTFSWMPESPYFYLMKGQVEAARNSLKVFRGTEDVEEELGRMSKAVREQEENKGSFKDLLTVKSNRRGMLITLGLRGVQQLTGTTAIIFYCKTIFKESGSSISSRFATIIYFGVQLVLSAVSGFVVDFSGRKPLLIASITGTGLCLLINAVYVHLQRLGFDTAAFDFIPIVALLCFVVVFSIGMQTIPLLMMGEMFPTDVKAFALCSMDIYYSIIVVCISKFFHWTKEMGLHVPFYTFAGCCVLGLVFIVWVVPETKGKTLEDIQAQLRGERHVGGYGSYRTKETVRKLEVVC